MWQVLGLVYFIAAGQPIGEPLKIQSRESFGTLGACVDYLKSDAYQKVKADLASQMEALLPKPEIDPNADDPYADPDAPDAETEVTITASCQADNRL